MALNEDKDLKIVAATAHWAHRMVTNGVPLADFQDVTNNLSSWENWCEAWMKRGEIHALMGEDSFSAGQLISASEHFRTAAVCFHFGKFLFVHNLRQMKEAHNLTIFNYNKALPIMTPPGERVQIPFEGRVLYGNLRKPNGIKNPPIVIMCMGLDSTKEEMYTNEAPFLMRGMATLAFDGPGQGEAEFEMPIRFDYEVPVGAVIDFLENRNDIDLNNIGIWGVSLGGYYAPRAAAFEKRIKACISLTGPFDFAEALERAPALTREAFISRSHSEDLSSAQNAAEKINLSSVADKITCPLYIVGGALDRVIPPDHAQKLANATSGDVTLNMVEDGTHVVNNRPYKYRSQSADWMAENLAK